jgi:TonB-dependent receptor
VDTKAAGRRPQLRTLCLAVALALASPVVAAAAAAGEPEAANAKSDVESDAALAAAVADAPAVAQAGTPAPADEDDEGTTAPEGDEKRLAEVVVTYRASLVKALEIKRDAVGQVDAIVAEDIADFPDLNLAESLQRVPGVSISRDAGEGRNISVRGLDANFTRVRINGMEALSTAGGTDSSGGLNRGRGFDFNVFASELFNNIVVRKTSSADLEEGSLGATVDLNVAHPLDYDGFTLLTAAQAGYNSLAESWDPRGVALISNTWADGTFGALMSVAYTDREVLEEGHSTVRWDNGTSSGGFNASSPFAPARLATTFHPRIPRYGSLGHEQERIGATASLQFNPNPDTMMTFDVLYADFDATRSEDFLEAISFSRTGTGKPQTIVRDGFVGPDGDLEYGLFDDVDVRSESRYDELSTKFTQYVFNGSHRLSDSVEMSAIVGRAKSEHDNPIQTTITIDRSNTDGYSWDYRDDDRLPRIDYGFDVNDPTSWVFAQGLSEIRLRPQTSDNTFDNAGLDLDWSINETWSFQTGFLWKRYEFETSEIRRASETTVPALPAGVSLADLLRIQRFGDGLGQPSGNDTQWLAPDINAFNEIFDIYCNCGQFTLTNASALTNNRGVEEKDTGFYFQFDWAADIGDTPFRGNFGGRWVETDQESTGFAVVNNTPVAVTVQRDYDDFLPSFNLAADLTDELVLRFAAAKVVTRPGLGNLTPGVTVSVSGGNRVVTGGDPFLDPFRATTADVGLEWYFAEESLLSAAYFWKDISSFVQTSRETRPYNTSGLPEELLAGTGASPEDDFQFNIPVNTPGGKVRGVELIYQQPFVWLPPGWDNLGLQLNYTHVDSEIQYVTSTGVPSLVTDLTGLSRNAWNATLYYEDDKWGARVSWAYRDEFLTTVPGRNNNDVEGTRDTLTVDASISYSWNEHLELSLEGLNLTDEFQDQYVSSIGDRPSVYHHTGRQYLLGVRYRF